MPFKLNNIVQSRVFFYEAKENLYKKASESCENHETLMRFSGLPIALVSAGLTIAERVATIGETIIKGFANVFGAIFSEKGRLVKGATQLFYHLPNVVWRLGCSALKLPVRVVLTTLRMLVNPKEYSWERVTDMKWHKMIHQTINAWDEHSVFIEINPPSFKVEKPIPPKYLPENPALDSHVSPNFFKEEDYTILDTNGIIFCNRERLPGFVIDRKLVLIA